MGQYHRIASLDRREFIDPHALGTGLKLWEQTPHTAGEFHGSPYVLAAWMLLNGSPNRGGGDYRVDRPDILGRWAGTRVALVGDYTEVGDFPGAEFFIAGVWGDGAWTDITAMVAEAVGEEAGVMFTGSGWRNVEQAG